MLRVLTYHRVDRPERTPHLDPSLISAEPDDFRRQMEHLARWYRPVSLDEVLASFVERRALPSRAVHVTFDDAYVDFATEAWPVLKELGIPATLFVATAYPGHPERCFWWDRLHRAQRRGLTDHWEVEVRRTARRFGAPGAELGSEIEPREMLRHLPHDEAERLVDLACDMTSVRPPTRPTVLDWDEIRALADEGVAIGAHTVHHAALPHIELYEVRLEIRGSLDTLERELGTRPAALSYPYGVYDNAVARLAEIEGCVLGFTCDDGLNRPGQVDPLQLRRTNITRRTSPPVFSVRMLPWFAKIDQWRHREEEELRSA